MRTAALAGLLLPLLGAAPALAFQRTHVDPSRSVDGGGDNGTPCLFWGTRNVPYQLSARGSLNPGADQAALATALRTSMQQWTDVACSDFTFVDQGTTTSLEVGYNPALLNQPMLVGDVPPHNTVLFRKQSCSTAAPANDACRKPENDDCASIFDCWGYGDGIIALTSTTYSFETGQIFDGDIELNESTFTFTTSDGLACPSVGPQGPGCISTDLRNTVTHEAGHLLGLGHSVDPTATMFYSAARHETSKRNLAPDDIAGLCAIYPTGQPALTCNEPNFKSGCGCGAIDGVGLAPLGLLLVARRRRR
jgi:uncharacterized protein (TIGR03382 family)